jgi:hypothetical protein
MEGFCLFLKKPVNSSGVQVVCVCKLVFPFFFYYLFFLSNADETCANLSQGKT